MKRSPLRRVTAPRRGGFKPVDPHLRSEVMARDGGCVARRLIPSVACGGRLDPHHIVIKGMGGRKRPDVASDLITLCRMHHDWVHLHRPEATRLGLLAWRE